MKNNTKRKYKKLTEESFNQIKRSLSHTNKKDLAVNTELSVSRIYKIKKNIETSVDEPTFCNFIDKKGPKYKDFSSEKAKIREIFARDNALTQVGAKKILDGNTVNSKSKISRLVKSSGLTRKRLKRKASVTFEEPHMQRRALYAA
ncbi:hypothetical protein DMUE_1149 [Dictyocoela muelleri]|nr:hypothetical protein DMUE_1149 [Dictyocoela muelleri]